MIQDTSKSLFLSPKVYSQGCFQAKWEITARTVKCLLLCPSLVKFLCPAAILAFSVQLLARNVLKVCPTGHKKSLFGLKYFFFQPSTTESPIARILKHLPARKGPFINYLFYINIPFYHLKQVISSACRWHNTLNKCI